MSSRVSRAFSAIALFIVAIFVLIVYHSHTADRSVFHHLSYFNLAGSGCDSVKASHYKALHTDIKQLLAKAARHLSSAHRYARSGKTIVELGESYKLLIGALDALHTFDASVAVEEARLNLSNNVYYNPNVTATAALSPTKAAAPNASLDVCPEVYPSNTYGYPFYFKGFEMLDCHLYNVRPFSQVLSVLLNFVDEIDLSNAGHILRDINESGYRDLQLYIATANEANRTSIEQQLSGYNLPATVIITDHFMKLTDNISTDYVFVARELLRFDWNSRLERLVRMVSAGVADLAAGSHRLAAGYWVSGCHQVGLKNYTVRLVEGYDLSYNSCMYCDYSSGPFVIRTDLLKQFASRELKGQNLYLDLMLSFSQKDRAMMTCPDAMFYTRSIGVKKSDSKSDWFPLVQKWELNRVIFPDNTDILFTCSEAKIGCYKGKGYIVSICCLGELTHMLNVMHDLFMESHIEYELDGGSVLGNVKIENASPWERDHDVALMARDFDAVLKLNDRVKQWDYRFVLDTKPGKCMVPREECVKTANINCGYIAYRGPNWRIEFWGVNCLMSEANPPPNGFNMTLIRNAGHWIRAPTNPGLFGRSHYGVNVLRHAEHWGSLGAKTGWINYEAGKFSSCDRPHFHGCLDNYIGDGNLHFRDVWV